MKKLYSFAFLALFFLAKNSAAQAFSTCSTPTPINWYTSVSWTAITSTPNTDVSNDYGCISPANNAYWFYFQACSSGNLNLLFGSYLSSATDVNMIAWGPLAAPTDCGLTALQILDCSTTSGTYDTLSFNIIAGSYYKLLVSNPSNSIGTFNISPITPMPFYSDTCYACSGMIPAQEICQVTTDPVQNRNIIIWEKDTTYTGDYIIERESTTMGVYTTLATVMSNDTSAYVDSISNPMIQSFKYRIVTNDTCGNINNSGADHQTIHLLTSISSGTGYPQLAWNPYAGFYYGTYYIYRGASPPTLAVYDSISASFNSYTDVAAVPGMNYYSVAVMPAAPCQPSRAMSMPSLSNVSPVLFTGINEYQFNQLSVGPNPANNVLNFSLGSVSAHITVDMIDITGRVISSKTFKNVTSDAIDLAEIANGSYVIRFSSENKTTHRSIIIAR